jgi:hypothetical protein
MSPFHPSKSFVFYAQTPQHASKNTNHFTFTQWVTPQVMGEISTNYTTFSSQMGWNYPPCKYEKRGRLYEMIKSHHGWMTRASPVHSADITLAPCIKATNPTKYIT